MHLDLAQADADIVRDADVCVVGSGAAGISAARRLLARGRSVLLLESGGLDYEREIASLNAGESVGQPYYDLEDARLRFFGGTTAIWGGRIAALDPIDFQHRPWIPHSGWPFGIEALARYYDEARREFGLTEPPLSAEAVAQAIGAPSFDRDRLALALWEFDGRFDRFTFRACADLVNHPRCTVATHATVTEIGLARGGSGVAELTVRSLSGRRLTVRPRTVLLAAGGIETPRLMLASRSVQSAGVGNDRDLVGRFFMEHPHARGGRIAGGRPWSILRAFGRTHRIGGRKAAALIRLSDARQAQAGLLNTSLTIGARQPAEARQFWGMRAYVGLKHDLAPTRSGRAAWITAKRMASWTQRQVDPLRPWLLQKAGRLEVALVVRAEQAPNPDSRITLSSTGRDRLGVPRPVLDWRLNGLDTASVRGLVATLGDELARLGCGRVEPASWLEDEGGAWRTDPMISVHPLAGYHHMGTTRMADDPAKGVVDGYGRVHGVDNLYVVGSSVFPTSGWANPTLTIVALALRTADRIAA